MRSDRLDSKLVLSAYCAGCFPMPDPDEPSIVRWYRPNPRAIIPLGGFHVSRSLNRAIRRGNFMLRVNSAFKEVMHGCAARKETWITDDFMRVYGELHALGFAHSIEIYQSEMLVGGVYGVAIGGAFFAESMFHRETGASKLALLRLVERLREKGFLVLECQFLTDHLKSLGAVAIPDSDYMQLLSLALKIDVKFA